MPFGYEPYFNSDMNCNEIAKEEAHKLAAFTESQIDMSNGYWVDMVNAPVVDYRRNTVEFKNNLEQSVVNSMSFSNPVIGSENAAKLDQIS